RARRCVDQLRQRDGRERKAQTGPARDGWGRGVSVRVKVAVFMVSFWRLTGLSVRFSLSEKCLERFNRRDVPWTPPAPNHCEPAHERPHRLSRPKTRSALQAHAAVSAPGGQHALQE